jgi:predicted kinase
VRYNIAEGLYSPAQSDLVYSKLASIAGRLLSSGENVIVDAANLQLRQRQEFYSAAKTAGAICTLVQLTAPIAILRERIENRKREGGDPSDADIAVLEWQRTREELPTTAEPLLTIDTRDLTIQELLSQISRTDDR